MFSSRFFRNALMTVSMAVITASTLDAQGVLKTGYFTEGYQYRYKINPAIQNDLGFMAIPAIGNINISSEANAGLKTFLYPNSDGTLSTFLSPKVTKESFVSSLPERTKLNLGAEIPILSFGFRTDNTYNTFDLTVNAGAGLSVPKELLQFIKNGEDNLQANNIGMRLQSTVEAAYGISFKVAEGVTIGARLKAMLGILNAEGRVNEMNFSANEDLWRIQTSGYYNISGITSYKYDENGIIRNLSFENGLDLTSFGGAIDLGFNWKINDYFTLSSAIDNIGIMTWNNVIEATAAGNTEFEGFRETTEDDTFDEQVADAWDQLGECFTFSDAKNIGKKKTTLSPTLHVGVQAFVPGAEKLSFGVLASRQFGNLYDWSSIRLSANYAPAKWFSISASAAQSTYGFSAGALMSFHGRGLSFFIGSDDLIQLTSLSMQGIPINKLSASVSLGLAISFGSYRN